MAGLPQRWLLGADLRSTDCLFWAARREAITGLESARGTARFLPWLVAMRGFRVGETTVRFQPGHEPARDVWPHPADLLAVWWLRRRYRPAKVEELHAGVAEVATPLAAGASHWIDTAQGRVRREADTRQRDSA